MQTRLPEFCDLHQLAEKKATISGSWPVAKMPRLLEMLASEQGEAIVDLEFGKSGRTRFVKGHVKADVEVVCQRCLQNAVIPLESEFELALITTEAEIDRLPDQFEPLITEGRHFLPDVIEDELILSVPIVPAHESDCSAYLNEQKQHQATTVIAEEEAKVKENPFSVLKDLL